MKAKAKESGPGEYTVDESVTGLLMPRFAPDRVGVVGRQY